MILSGQAIRQAYKEGDLEISPYDERLVNPASIDLRLSNLVLTYEAQALDAARSHHYIISSMPAEGYWIYPGNLYLMCTEEIIRTMKYVTVIDGKSSMGRLGISIHQTAGYGDPGYWGQYTLEVSCMMPVKIYAGMRFCQARFHTIYGNLDDYQKTGHYITQDAPVLGPKPSQAFRQLQKAL